jgi:predicted amino acid racemase
MFLDLIRRRSPRLIEQAISLHQQGKLPANGYVIDLDSVEENARAIASEAAKFGLSVMAMTKQMGRHAAFCRAAMRGGIAKSVAVDIDCARATHRAGMRVGHLGHLVQIPRGEADEAPALAPDCWTVFNLEKASEVGAASLKRGREQALLPGSGRRAISSIAATRAGSRRLTFSRSLVRSIRFKGRGSPALRLFLRFSSTPRTAR